MTQKEYAGRREQSFWIWNSIKFQPRAGLAIESRNKRRQQNLRDMVIAFKVRLGLSHLLQPGMRSRVVPNRICKM